jgi:2-keto-4-pentenoate hydratase/2-oxohepta-3-ene-1,7-dioic acid hydratase in catechol pathway
MKIISFVTVKKSPGSSSNAKVGIMTEKGIIDFSAGFQTYLLREKGKRISVPNSVSTLMEQGLFDQNIFRTVKTLVEKDESIKKKLYFEFNEVKLKPPISRPGKIIALGRNYAAHARETGDPIPSEPIIFQKASSAVIGPDEPIIYHNGLTRVDPEVELAVVIGKRATKISAGEAEKVIAGYTIMNDITARDMQTQDIELRNPWFRSKSMDTFAPLGPCIVLTDEINMPVELNLELQVNGEVRQKDNTRNMIFKIPQLIEYISHHLTLEAGDIISTGTPEGIKPIQPGDVVEAIIEKIGCLRNPVIKECI